jgi:hypothetical protein
MSRKSRECKECGNTWRRKFVRACCKCGSQNISMDSKIISQDDLLNLVPAENEYIDDLMLLQKETKIVHLLEDMYKSLPTNPQDPLLDTKSQEIFRILVYPNASSEICRQCNQTAPKVCEIMCDKFKLNRSCEHNLIVNNKYCCGEASFNPNCVNYSKKIGEYQKCSASLAARRVKKIRIHIKKYIIAHKKDPLCNELYEAMKEYLG